jgi:uncharacterized membrane protein
MSAEISYIVSLVVGINLILIGALAGIESLLSHAKKKRSISTPYSRLALVLGPFLVFIGFRLIANLF